MDDISSQPVDIDDYNDLHAFPIKTPDSMYDYEDDTRLLGSASKVAHFLPENLRLLADNMPVIYEKHYLAHNRTTVILR